MNKQEKEYYATKDVIEVYPMTNWGGIEILDVINDHIVYRFNFGEPKEPHKAKIKYGVRHNTFRTCAGYSIKLCECMYC